MEYKSRAALFGIPLIYVNTGKFENEKYVRGVARGWIALGNLAFGILFAAGAVSVGTLSIGGLSFGLLSLGGLTIGALAIGGGAIGLLAFGGAAVGLWAMGGLAVAWFVSVGGAAFATECAAGGKAVARDINMADIAPCVEKSMTAAIRFTKDHHDWVFLAALIAMTMFVFCLRSRKTL